MSSGIKIQQCPLDKDNSDNVPAIVVGSIRALSGSLSFVKKWADRHEDALKETNRRHQDLERRLTETDASLANAWGRLEELSQGLQVSSDERRSDLEGVSTCLGYLLRSSHSLIVRMGGALSEDASRTEPPPLDAEGAEACGSDSPTPQVADDAGGERPASQAASSLAALQESGALLSSDLDLLQGAIESWSRRREAELHHQQSLQSSVEELQIGSAKTLERLHSWRDMLKESSHVMDCLGNSLAETRGAVQDLQAAQVLHKDVDEAVNRRARQLEDLHAGTERRMDELMETMDTRSADLERMVNDAQQLTGERITEHGVQVAQMVERNMNPINAYLNTMHIKSDTMRAELDALNRCTTKLSERITEVSSSLETSNDEHRDRSQSNEEETERLAKDVRELVERTKQQHADLSSSLSALEETLSGRVDAVSSSTAKAAEDLDALRRGDVGAVKADLKTLEQKVAKWIHAHPLPAKISEARLFALEARLAEESDARLTLEHQVGPRSARLPQGFTPRSYGGADGGVGGALLPHLPAQPWGGEAAGRSGMYDAYRLQASSKMPKA
mmetsp:Transcript_68912/g.199909  ORF Transcript_68912/g.199909 Transcript_68912/m.199909 type:complete len:562 (-) Transcript_68912:68-1753(-)